MFDKNEYYNHMKGKMISLGAIKKIRISGFIATMLITRYFTICFTLMQRFSANNQRKYTI